MTVGLVVLVVLRPELSGSTHFTLPKVQIAIGVLLVLAAVVMATKASPRRFGGQRRAGAPVGRLAARIRHLLDAPSLWIAGAAGLGIALPSVDYLAALAVILASGATLATQVGGLVIFNVVAFTFVEIPLLAYLAAPAKTQRSVAAVQGWIRSGHRRAALLAAVGCVLLAVGIASL